MKISDLSTPAALIDIARMERNISRMQTRMNRLGVSFRPHVKTSKCVNVTQAQIKAGARGITVSTLKEAEQFFAAGITDILYAVGITANKLPQALALLHKGCDLKILTDSVQSAAAISAFGMANNMIFKVMIEIDTDDHRSGIKPESPQLLDVAKALAVGGAELFGVMTHAGSSYDLNTPEALEQMAEQERAGCVRASQRLREAGFVVEQGLRALEGEELNVGFFSRMRRQRPWLRLKMAASLDGRTATASGESQWITSEAAREDVQRWRAESAAILSTSATVLADDPRLSVRLDSARLSAAARQPLRVLLDREKKIPPHARLFSEPGEVLHLTSKEIALDASGRLSLPAVLSTLNAREINEVWTEAGATLAGSLIASDLVDELVVYLAPMLLGSEGRPLAALQIGRLLDASRWQTTDLRQIGSDIRIMLRPLRSA
jgi:riboflavin biosynthesis protein RibD